MVWAVRALGACALSLFALAACVDSDFGDGNAVRTTIHESFSAQSNVHLTVGNISGDVTVVPWSRSTIDVVAVKHAGSKEGLRRVTVEIDRDQVPASDVRIRTHYEHHWFGNEEGSVDYTLHVPRGTSLVVDEVSGDVRANSLGGNVEVHSVSGDVTTLDVGGNLYVHSISGDVHTSMLHMANDNSADIETVSGEIHLALPVSASAYVDASSLSGDFDCAWPIPQQRTIGMHADGNIGHGGGSVRLRSISGDIHLTQT
jgi:DUF4097 and DUF4098 domain-containing protein YvlB